MEHDAIGRRRRSRGGPLRAQCSCDGDRHGAKRKKRGAAAEAPGGRGNDGCLGHEIDQGGNDSFNQAPPRCNARPPFLWQRESGATRQPTANRRGMAGGRGDGRSTRVPAFQGTRMRKIALSVLILTALASAATAAEPGLPNAVILQLINGTLLSGTGLGSPATREQVLAAITRPIRLYDIDGNGLTREELDAAGNIAVARQRAERAGRLLVADLNNDQRITREEYMLTARSTPSLGQTPDTAFDLVDTNKDGVLDWQEITTLPTPNAPTSMQATVDRWVAVTFGIDPTPTTPFTLDDAAAVTDGLFAAIDTDKDNVLEASEIRAVRTAPFGNLNQMPGCWRVPIAPGAQPPGFAIRCH